MCRFVAYHGQPILLSKLLHEPENSLINQSYRARERLEPLNGDGFGLGWYVPEVSNEPALFRSIRPAWNDQNLLSLGSKTRASSVFAHVRAATHGGVIEENCHPFQYGSLLMMHNGSIGGFEGMKRKCRVQLPDEVYHWVNGSTDSQHFFGVLLANLPNREKSAHVTVEQIKKAFLTALDVIVTYNQKLSAAGPILLNVAITNGKWMFATKYISDTSEEPNTLYYSTGARYECTDGVCKMVECSPGERSLLIVSEKLTDFAEDWRPVPLNNCLLVTAEGEVTLEEIQI